MDVTTDEVFHEAVPEILDRNAAVLVDGGDVTAEERKIEADNRGERKTESETPPEDDCCPICFSSFTVPCRGNCGHWYCG